MNKNHQREHLQLDIVEFFQTYEAEDTEAFIAAIDASTERYNQLTYEEVDEAYNHHWEDIMHAF